MKNKKQYRTNGAIGALLDEYEKAVTELKEVISTISHADLLKIVDKETKDKDCQSIQSILAHVVKAGYHYIDEIRKWKGEEVSFKGGVKLESSEEYTKALDNMFQYNVQLFEDYPDMELEHNDNANKMKVVWGQVYDVEQLMEHAIVHVLRHRRQIERFLNKM